MTTRQFIKEKWKKKQVDTQRKFDFTIEELKSYCDSWVNGVVLKSEYMQLLNQKNLNAMDIETRVIRLIELFTSEECPIAINVNYYNCEDSYRSEKEKYNKLFDSYRFVFSLDVVHTIKDIYNIPIADDIDTDTPQYNFLFILIYANNNMMLDVDTYYDVLEYDIQDYVFKNWKAETSDLMTFLDNKKKFYYVTTPLIEPKICKYGRTMCCKHCSDGTLLSEIEGQIRIDFNDIE